jgi:hypothetical protein
MRASVKRRRKRNKKYRIGGSNNMVLFSPAFLSEHPRISMIVLFYPIYQVLSWTYHVYVILYSYILIWVGIGVIAIGMLAYHGYITIKRI